MRPRPATGAALFRGRPACLQSLKAIANARMTMHSTSRSSCALPLSSSRTVCKFLSPGQPVTWHRVRIQSAVPPSGPTDTAACTTSGRALRTSHALTANTLRVASLARNTKYAALCEQAVEDGNFLWKAMENEEEIFPLEIIRRSTMTSSRPACFSGATSLPHRGRS
jgi:hypothetical protein